MRDKSTIYGIVMPGFVRFYGFSSTKAEFYATLFGGDVYSFDAQLIRNWLKKSSVHKASRCTVYLSILESEALALIGKQAPLKDMPLKNQINILVDQLKTGTICPTFVSFHVMLMGGHDAMLTKLLNEESSTVVKECGCQILELLRHSENQPLNAELDRLLLSLENMLMIAHTQAISNIIDSIYVKIMKMMQYVLEYLNESLDKDSLINIINNELYSLDKNQSMTRCDIRERSVDKSTVNRVLRWKKRCNILDCIIDNAINAFGKTQKQIASETEASIGLVNKINSWYVYDNNITHDDLWENIRGKKPNTFKVIPCDVYQELCQLMCTKSPVEVGLNFFSWSACAIYFYLKTKNLNVKLSYIYDWCRRVGLSSKFASRKNAKENINEIEYFINEKYPEICRQALVNNTLILFLDECHVAIDHHFEGYSPINTDTIGAYDTSLEHSSYTIVTFMGLNGFIRIFHIKGTFDSGKLTDCLTDLKKELKGKNIHIIMDNSPIHTSYESFGGFADNCNQFQFDFLPRYCPRMNPVEFFNNIYKKELKKNSVLAEAQVVNKSKNICNKYNSADDRVKEEIQCLFLKEECAYSSNIYDEMCVTFLNGSAA